MINFFLQRKTKAKERTKEKWKMKEKCECECECECGLTRQFSVSWRSFDCQNWLRVKLSFSPSHENSVFSKISFFASGVPGWNISFFSLRARWARFQRSVKQTHDRKRKRLKYAFLCKRKYSAYANIRIDSHETTRKPIAGLTAVDML